MDFDIFLPFRIPLKILKIFGLWQTEKSSWIYFMYGIVMHLFFLELFTILQFGYLFSVETFADFANLMSMLPTYFALCVKSINWFYNLSQIEALFDLITENLNSGTVTEKMKNHVKRVDKIFKIFWGSAASSCVLGAFVPFVAHQFPYRMWFPYNYEDNAFMFYLAAIYQIVDTLCYSGVDIVFDTFPVMFMSYILAMLQQLGDRLEDLKKNKRIEGGTSDGVVVKTYYVDNTKELLQCIKYQKNILEITKRVEKFFSVVFLVRGLMSTLILCTTSFALTIVRIKATGLSFSKHSYSTDFSC